MRLRKVPSGFKVHHHFGKCPRNYFDKVLFNASCKLMMQTINYYTNELKGVTDGMRKYLSLIKSKFPDNLRSIRDQEDKKIVFLNSKLCKSHFSKFQRDGIDLSEARLNISRAADVNAAKVFVGSQISQYSDNIAPLSATASTDTTCCDFQISSPDQISLDVSRIDIFPLDSSINLSFHDTDADLPITFHPVEPTASEVTDSSEHPDSFPLDNHQPEVEWFQSSWSPPSPQFEPSFSEDVRSPERSTESGFALRDNECPHIDPIIVTNGQSMVIDVEQPLDIALERWSAIESSAVINSTEHLINSNDESLVDILANINSTEHLIDSNDESIVDILANINNTEHLINFDSSHILNLSDNFITNVEKESLRESLLANTPKHTYAPILLCSNPEEIPPDFIELCKKGPTFIPTPKHVDWLDVQKDFDNLSNRVRYMANSYDPESSPQDNPAPARVNDGPPRKGHFPRQPKSSIPSVEAFLIALQNDIFSRVKSNYTPDNLSPREREALGWWQNNVLFNSDSKLCIRMQDKGSRFVIVDKDEDISKAHTQISRSSFLSIEHDLTPRHVDKVKSWATKWLAKGKITQKWFDYIVNENATPAKNSTLYKTHKSGNPVRLLTAGCNTAIENLCHFVEKHTYPLVQNLPSRIKDTAHFLEIIDTINEKPLSPDVHLVSFDIVNMFPSISNEQGIKSVKAALLKRSDRSVPTSCIIEALVISLSCNNSKFNDQHLLQTDGTAMGAPNSCSYADLATMHIDEKVDLNKDIYSELSVFRKYRDDVFSLWCGEVRRIDNFLSFLNSIDKNLQFTMEIGIFFKVVGGVTPLRLFSFLHNDILNSGIDALVQHNLELLPGGIFTMWTSLIADVFLFLESLNAIDPAVQFTPEFGKLKSRFLDLEVSIKDHKLHHTVYRKPTNSCMYLDFSSCHPIGSKNGIVKGVALRLRRLCSTTEEYLVQSKLFMSSLAARGHDPHIIHREFKVILNTPRWMVRQHRKPKEMSGSAMFITKYNPRGPNFGKIINNNLPLLQSDPVARHIFPKIPLVYKRCNNLSESILRADPYNLQPKGDISDTGTQHCGKIYRGKPCDLCENLVHSNKFKCFATNRVFFYP